MVPLLVILPMDLDRARASSFYHPDSRVAATVCPLDSPFPSPSAKKKLLNAEKWGVSYVGMTCVKVKMI